MNTSDSGLCWAHRSLLSCSSFLSTHFPPPTSPDPTVIVAIDFHLLCFCWIPLMSPTSLPSACLSVRLLSQDTKAAREAEEEEKQKDRGLGWKELDSFSTRAHTHTGTDVMSLMICIQLEDHKLQPTPRFIVHWFICGSGEKTQLNRKLKGLCKNHRREVKMIMKVFTYCITWCFNCHCRRKISMKQHRSFPHRTC